MDLLENSCKLCKKPNNDIYIPHDSDFVIEGFVDPNELRDEAIW